MKGPEGSHSPIKKFIEVSNEAGLSRDEKREVLSKVAEKKSEDRFSETKGLVNNITEEKIEAFMALISGNQKFNYAGLLFAGNTLREYGTRGNKESLLSPLDQKLASLMIKYIEDWFYNDGVVKLISQEENDLGSVAFLVNQLAKIKEVPEYRETIKSFNSEKLNQFMSEVSENVPTFFSREKMREQILKKENMKKQLEQEVDVAYQQGEPARKKMEKMENDFDTMLANTAQSIEDNIGLIPEKQFFFERKHLLEFLEEVRKYNKDGRYYYPENKTIADQVFDLKKSKMVQDTRNQVYDHKHPLQISGKAAGKQLTVVLDEANKQAVNKFEKFKESIQRIHEFLIEKVPKTEESSSKKTTKLVGGFEALGSLIPNFKEEPDYKSLLIAVEKFTVKKFPTENNRYQELLGKIRETNYYELRNKASSYEGNNMHDERVLRNSVSDYEKILQEFNESMSSVKESLKDTNGPAALYFIKSLLIAASETRNDEKLSAEYTSESKNKTHVFDPVFQVHSKLSQGKPVYQFSYGSEKMFDKVHYEPKHMMFVKFALEYQWQKCHAPKQTKS